MTDLLLAKTAALKNEIAASLRSELASIDAALPDLAAAIRAEPIGVIRNRLCERCEAMIHRSVSIEIALADAGLTA